MAYYASNLIQDALRRLGQFHEELVSSGSATTAVVDKFSDTVKFPYEDEEWKEGTLFVIRTTDAAAPQGQYQRISAYTSDTGTFTIDTALTAVIGALDTIGWCGTVYPIQTLLSLASRGLASLGEIALPDTSITTAASQTEYTYPVALKGGSPLRIQIQGITTDANDNQWYDLGGWYITPAAAGTTGLIVFNLQPTADRNLKVWYRAIHPALTVYNSEVHETVHPELAVAILVERALEWRNTTINGTDDFLLRRWTDAKTEKQLMEVRHPIWSPPVMGQPLIFSQVGMINGIR